MSSENINTKSGNIEKTTAGISLEAFIAAIKIRGPRQGRRVLKLDKHSDKVDAILAAGGSPSDVFDFFVENQVKVSLSTVHKYCVRRNKRNGATK